MKKLLCAIALIVGLTQVARADWWVVGIGKLDALFNQSIVDATFANQIAANPYDGIDATFQSMYAGRQDVENRISAATKELCDHDANFCSDVFQKYALKWQGN